MTSPILNELKFFINGVYRGLPDDYSSQLVKCSLTLLEELPSSREVVLDYFSVVFDTSVSSYIQFIEKNPQGTPAEDVNISNIQDALDRLITSGPAAWAPLISAWSLRILGSLSNKYSRGRVMDIGSSCTLWISSDAMRCLLGLAASCFGKLNSAETEECISILLGTFVQNSPHFDWVVARLGGCFPLKVISKILQCGLKGFVGNQNSTLDSEVGILGYLSYAYEPDLRFALKEMLEVVLNKKAISQPQINTIPYLLHLCSMSDILLQPIVNVFLDLFNETLIPTLVAQSKQWQNFNSRDCLPVLSTLVMKLKVNATKSVITLAKISEHYMWCQDFLENILQELEGIVLEDRSCPLLIDMTKDESAAFLWESCVSENILEQQTAVRLLLIVAQQCPFIYHQTICRLLTKSYSTNKMGLSSIIRILSIPQGCSEQLHAQPGIEMALEEIKMRIEHSYSIHPQKDLNILKNLLILTRLEKQNATPHLRQMIISQTTANSISKILDIFDCYMKREMKMVEIFDPKDLLDDAKLLVSEEPLEKKTKFATEDDQCDDENNVRDINKNTKTATKQIHVLAQLLNALDTGGAESALNMTDVIKLATLTVKYFFWSLTENHHNIRTIAVNRAYSMLTRQCIARKSSRTIALRELLEGALFLYGNLFGAQNENMDNDQRKDLYLLKKLNQKQGTAPNSIRSILHAGIIGQGLKTPTKESSNPLPNMQNMFLMAVSACCKSDELSSSIDGFLTVALLLVELVSTDVMYNGLPWPDEEMFTKVTMERDLQIRRTFKNAPILWGILGLVAANRPAICFTSVLLRALCASILHQWRAKTVDKFQNTNDNIELFSVTRKLLEVLSMSQLLPPPLNYLHTVIEHLDPPEIAVVLKDCIWNYMKDNVPSPVLYSVDSSGLHWRDSVAAQPPAQFVDPLRNIMQRKLPKLGTFYHHMFVLPEFNEISSNKNWE